LQRLGQTITIVKRPERHRRDESRSGKTTKVSARPEFFPQLTQPVAEPVFGMRVLKF
jgi:hypothetical protein